APSNGAAWLGTALHSAVEFLQIRRMDGRTMDADWLIETFLDTFDHPDEDIDFSGWDRDNLRKGGITIARMLHPRLISRPVPTRTEHSLWMDLDDEWGMLAYADWEEKRDGSVRVVDLKTTGARWAQKRSDSETQAAILTVLTRLEHPEATFSCP